MRITVLEWICGGGLLKVPVQQVPASLRREGWAMLHCLVTQFADAGNEVTTVLDRRLVDQNDASTLPAQVVDIDLLIQGNKEGQTVSDRLATLQAWQQLARRSELSLVIAPELDGILQYCVAELSRNGAKLLNCREPFLTAACDKWITAQRLAASEVSHPATWLATEFPSQAIKLAERWCLKPRLGAGCDGLMIVSAKDVKTIVDQHLPNTDDWIVQPWIEGKAFSCSTIADCHGTDKWLPLVTQDLRVRKATWKDVFEVSSLSYCGGRIIMEPDQPRPIELLNSALQALKTPLDGALGWIGVDLVQDWNGQWFAIEINPRMTTSVLGLSRSATSNLGQQIIDGFLGKLAVDSQSSEWSATQFSAE